MAAATGRTDAAGRAASRSRPVSAVVGLLRVAGAGLLGANAGIHAHLWAAGYRGIAVIGPLFLADVVAASVLALGVLVAPRRWLAATAGSGALLELATAGGLVLATRVGLFGFTESSRATLYWQAVGTELAGFVALVLLAGLVLGRVTSGRAVSGGAVRGGAVRGVAGADGRRR